MSIWNKVLIGLIIVASLGFFYSASRVLKTHQYWRELAAKFETAIKEQKLKKDRLINGSQGEPGIRQTRVALDGVLVDRGRVWRNCEAKVVKANKEMGDAEVRVSLNAEDPNNLPEKDRSVVYAFEEATAREKGRYLGEFRISASEEKQATLTPAQRLTFREVDRIATAKGPWVLYEEMPRDNHVVFADLSDDDKKAILPADSAMEYVKDGKAAEAGDPQDRVVDGNFVRQLRDYRLLFYADRANLTEMLQLFDATRRDKALVDAALADAKKQEEISRKHVAEAKKEFDRFARERDIVAAHRKTLEEKVANVTAAVAKLIETNKAKALLLAQNQWDAVRRIDQRTRDMVQADAGGK